MVDAPCSRVGHIYRKFAPFPNPGVGDFVGRVSSSLTPHRHTHTHTSPCTPLLCVSIFKHCWLTTASWKNASRVLESFGKVLECFVTKRVGTLVNSGVCLVLSWLIISTA